MKELAISEMESIYGGGWRDLLSFSSTMCRTVLMASGAYLATMSSLVPGGSVAFAVGAGTCLVVMLADLHVNS